MSSADSSTSSASFKHLFQATTSIPVSESDLEHLFRVSAAECRKLDDSDYSSSSPEFQHIVQALIQNFFIISTCIAKFGILSPNEELDGIKTADLKYYLTSYYLGTLFSKVYHTSTPQQDNSAIETLAAQQKRFKNLQQSLVCTFIQTICCF